MANRTLTRSDQAKARKALARAVKLLGKNAAVRDNGYPSSPETRAEALARARELRAREPKILPLSDWPATTTIGEYRTALAAHRQTHAEWKRQHNEAQGDSFHYRYRVGRVTFAFEVLGEGDTWEDALGKAEKNQ